MGDAGIAEVFDINDNDTVATTDCDANGWPIENKTNNSNNNNRSNSNNNNDGEDEWANGIAYEGEDINLCDALLDPVKVNSSSSSSSSSTILFLQQQQQQQQQQHHHHNSIVPGQGQQQQHQQVQRRSSAPPILFTPLLSTLQQQQQGVMSTSEQHQLQSIEYDVCGSRQKYIQPNIFPKTKTNEDVNLNSLFNRLHTFYINNKISYIKQKLTTSFLSIIFRQALFFVYRYKYSCLLITLFTIISFSSCI